MLFETSSTNELKSSISVLPFLFHPLIIPFQIRIVFPSFSCSAIYTKPVISTKSHMVHSLVTCSIAKMFSCNIFLSILSSVFLTEEKSFTIMSLVLSLERECNNTRMTVITYDIIEQSVFPRQKTNTPMYCIIILYCKIKISSFFCFWIPLLETPPKET